MEKNSKLKTEIGNSRRINLDKQNIREISIYELIERLSRYKNKSLKIAEKEDYDCYYMGYESYKQDLESKTYHIGYTGYVHLEGHQFHTVCTVTGGKITKLDVALGKNTINLCKLYIDNMEGKNIITHKEFEGTGEMPY